MCDCKNKLHKMEQLNDKLDGYSLYTKTDNLNSPSKLKVHLLNLFKFLLMLPLYIIVIALIIPYFIFVVIWNMFDKRQLGIKLPVFWFRRTREMYDELNGNGKY